MNDRACVTVCGDLRIDLRRAALEEIIALRHAELRPGLPRDTADFEGDASESTRHFGAFASREPSLTEEASLTREASLADVDAAADVRGRRDAALACASFMAQPYGGVPAYQLRGMATRGDLARHGIGRALLQYAVADLVTRDDARLFWCNARLAAAAFYERLGWRVVSDLFEVPTVGPHVAMTFDAIRD